MANNGHMVGGVCSSDIYKYTLSICGSSPTSPFYSQPSIISSSGVYYVSCRSPCVSGGGQCQYNSVVGSPFDCEISGPPLTEAQQIEAINALFPSAIAILAIAWGFKYIRVLVAEWLKERNASD